MSAGTSRRKSAAHSLFGDVEESPVVAGTDLVLKGSSVAVMTNWLAAIGAHIDYANAAKRGRSVVRAAVSASLHPTPPTAPPPAPPREPEVSLSPNTSTEEEGQCVV